MDGRTRRGAVALCVALTLALSGSVASRSPSAPANRPSAAADATSRDTAPVVIPDRYLVQTEGTPTALGGDLRAIEKARTELLAAVIAAGATVDRTYDATWTGIAITATSDQLDRITAAVPVKAVYPVYQLSLNDPDVSEPSADKAQDSATTETDPADGDPGDGDATEPGTDAPEDPDPTDDPPAATTAAVADEATTDYLTDVVVPVLANDTAATEATLLPESVVIVGAAEEGKLLEIADRGSFGVGADGAITFLPVAGWTGTLDPVTYQVTDSAGATVAASLTITMLAPPPPTAADDATQGTTGHTVTAAVLGNDTAGGRATLKTVCLPDGAGCGSSLETAQGLWKVDGSSVSFTPVDDFLGDATVTYRVADELGQSDEATLTVTVYAAPAASDHTVTTAYLTAKTVSVLDDEQPNGGAPLVPESLRLIDPESGEPVPSVTVAGKVGYEAHTDGSITVTPLPGAVGEAGRVEYTFSDAAGASVRAWLYVTVTAPDAPTVRNDEAHTAAGVALDVDVLHNDEANGGAELDAGSLCLLVDEACGASADDAFGTWLVTEDHKIRFTPSPGFLGAAHATYRVADDLGQTATATLTVTVTTHPIAADDKGHTFYRTATTVDVLANDSAGQDEHGTAGELLPGSVVLTANGERELTTDDGHYAVDPETGSITFSPADEVVGDVTTEYAVSDDFGNTATATLTIRVGRAPKAVADETATLQGVPVSLTPLTNDKPGDDGDQPPHEVPFDPSTVALVSGDDRVGSVTTPAGTWTVAEAGKVTLAPLPAFAGSATVDYEVSDGHNTVRATITVTVGAVTPRAADDQIGTPARNPVTIDVLGNDRVLTTDNTEVPPVGLNPRLDPTTVTLADHSTSAGTWAVLSDGRVRFTPAADYHGKTASTTYTVKDTNGTVSNAATITVTVGALTTVRSIQESTSQNVTLTVDPRSATTLGDDGSGHSGSLASVRLLDSAGQPQTLLNVDGQGLWQVVGDKISFNPETAFVGTTTQVRFQVTDSFGNTASALARVQVVAITPTIVADPAHTPANRAVTVPVLANDQPGKDIYGSFAAKLDYAKVKLVVDAATTASTLDTAKGTWSVTSSGVVFTPKPNVVGETSAQYRVLDHNDTPGFGWITVTVGALPKATADTSSTPQDGAPLTVSPLGNDTPGDDGAGATAGGFPAGSLVLTGSGAASGGKSLTTDSFTWTVTSSNQVTFTADWRYTGTTSTSYRVTDAFGNTTTSTITVTVNPTAATATEQRLAAIGATPAKTAGSGIKVGIIDSGIDYTHPDLGGGTSFPTSRVTKGRDYVDNDSDPRDGYGHGTHVAGIVGADGNPKLGGAYGVAPKVTFGAYRVFNNSGDANTADITKAIDQAYLDGMNVVNLSLGATSVSWPNETSYPLTQAAATLVKRGVVVVASAGNSSRGLFTAGSPAVAPGVIAVAATNAAAAQVESYSAMGPAADLSLSPTIASPGSGVHSTWLNKSFKDSTGTSMAAPEVAGAIAELLRVKGWTNRAAGIPAKVAALLYASASPLKSATSGMTDKADAVFRQGAGLLQLEAALATTVTASPATLGLGEGTSRTTYVTLTNSGTAPVSYQASAVTGTSAAASTGKKTDVGNQTPDWAYGAVGFSASPSKFTIPAGGSQKVKVKITAPSKILKGRNGMLYGGWVTFTGSGSRTVSVPFIGVRGDYQKVKMLPAGKRSFSAGGVSYTLPLPALAYRNSDGDLTQTTSGTRTFRTAKSDFPVLMYHLDYPTSAIRVKAINQKTKKSYYAVLSGKDTQLGRQGRDEGYTLTSFYGICKTSKGALARVPAGTYKLQLRVLRPLGSSSKSAHWETWTTRSFKVSWS